MDKIKLFELLDKLKFKKWTGQLRLNFHEGNLSEKIEKKESIKSFSWPTLNELGNEESFNEMMEKYSGKEGKSNPIIVK